MSKLGVNIDHVATLRQARGTRYPDPIAAAAIVEKGGADQITVHLREDRRHIQDADVRILRRGVQTELNLEMAATDEIVEFAIDLRPDSVTFVPEKRRELTTEGGLDLKKNKRVLEKAIPKILEKGIRVSLFVDPEEGAIEIAHGLKTDAIEIHTGCYCEAKGKDETRRELERLKRAIVLGRSAGLRIAAGHGLNYQNIGAVVDLGRRNADWLIEEYNIGHSIIARAIFVGLEQAVKEMKKCIS